MIQKGCPAPGKDTVILLCGSSDFKEKSMKPILKELGYDMDNVFGF